MFRRPLCCLLSKIFDFGPKHAKAGDEVLPLPRSTAEELVLSSILSYVALTDISVPYDDKVYATDASNLGGAVPSIQVGSEISSTVWLGGDRKGAYTMLDSAARQQLRSLGIDTDELPLSEDLKSPPKQLGFHFDFVEICGGSGSISKELASRGWQVCTPIDLSASPHFNLESAKLVDWILQMISEKRFRSGMCEPVCRTFSPAQHPSSRSYQNPLGFDRTEKHTLLGNIIAFRCILFAWFFWRHSAPSLLEQPKLSKMAWLDVWRYLLSIGFTESFTDSCAFGSIHRKPFRFLGQGLAMEKLNVSCPGGHAHVRIEGKYTKASAIYHPRLASFIADLFENALCPKDSLEEKAPPMIESVVLNDILQQPGWTVESSWEWKSPAHINVLESRSIVGLLKHLVVNGGDVRYCCLADSRVAKGAHAKGRSSAFALRPSLARACAYSIAGNLHGSLGFAPTRLNTADAPTRRRSLPDPAALSILDFLSGSKIAEIHSHQFSRAVAGWIRLYILVTFCLCPGDCCDPRPCFTDCQFYGLHGISLLGFSHFISPGFYQLITFLAGVILLSCIPWIFLSSPLGNKSNPNKLVFYPILVVFLGSANFAEAMPLVPSGRDEIGRANRRAGTVLQADRVILQSTRDKRFVLLEAFDAWLTENWRTNLDGLLQLATGDCEGVTEALVAYGKDLYDAGKSYGKYSETINAVTQKSDHTFVAESLQPGILHSIGSLTSPMSTTQHCPSQSW